MQMTAARITLSLAMLVYCATLIVIAVFPINTWHLSEILVVVCSGFAALALIVQMIPNRAVPGEKYAYLAVGFAGTVTMLTYIARSRQEDWVEAEVLMLLGMGVIASFGVHFVLDRREG